MIGNQILYLLFELFISAYTCPHTELGRWRDGDTRGARRGAKRGAGARERGRQVVSGREVTLGMVGVQSLATMALLY